MGRRVEKRDITGKVRGTQRSTVLFCLRLKMVDIRECFHVDGNKLLRKKTDDGGKKRYGTA